MTTPGFPTLPARVRLTATRIWTADPAHPWARAVELHDGRIASVDAPAHAGSAIPTIDLGDATVLPGLIDAHMHLSLGAATLAQVDLTNVRSRAEFESAIAAGAAELAAAGARAEPGTPARWLRAFGWHEANWGGERPTREWLRAAGRTPCVAYRMDQHACVVNDAVLALFEGAPCPVGGEIVRDAHGAPTGLLLEQAAWQLVNPRIPEPPAADRTAAARRAFAHCHAFGLTAVGSMEYVRDLRDVYAPLRATDRAACTLRILATILDRPWPVDLTWGRTFPGDELLAIVGWKNFIDGTLGSRTARMHAPYADDHADPQNRGMFVEHAAHSRERVAEWARAVLEAGFSPSVHVIGDEAMTFALDAIAPHDHGRIARYEHCQTMTDDDVARMHGRIASMQPLHKADDARIAHDRLGAARMHEFFRFRNLATAGARLAFGSDWPIVSCDPMLGVRAAVTGLSLDGTPCRTDQNVTVEEALAAYTRGAADCLRAPALGRIAPGAHADLCVLDRDPFACDWANELPRVAATVAGGRVVHRGAVESTP